MAIAKKAPSHQLTWNRSTLLGHFPFKGTNPLSGSMLLGGRVTNLFSSKNGPNTDDQVRELGKKAHDDRDPNPVPNAAQT